MIKIFTSYLYSTCIATNSRLKATFFIALWTLLHGVPVTNLVAQPTKLWDKTIGSDAGDFLYSLQQTSDGGYILGGISNSNIGGDKSENSKGGHDYWVVKLNAAGTIEWEKTIGGIAGDFLRDIQQTADGGYILGGYSDSNIGGDKTETSKGGRDYWVVKLNAAGTKEWDKTIGGAGLDYLYSLQQTSDGGYILGGSSDSNIGGDKSENSKGGYDYWVVKLNAAGAKEWDKTYGGGIGETLKSLQQTADGGYILGGSSISNISGDKSQNSKGAEDYWVVKLNAAGTKEWDKTYGGADTDNLNSLQQTADGGYILGGSSRSNSSGDKSQISGSGFSYWVVKLNAAGTIEWEKTIGTNNFDHLYSLQQTVDGGYILGGDSNAIINGDKTENTKGIADYWVVKLNAAGTKEWDKTIGGASLDYLYSLQQTSDGGYILGGSSDSNIGGDKSENSKGGNDYWVVKLSPYTTPERTITTRNLDSPGFCIGGVLMVSFTTTGTFNSEELFKVQLSDASGSFASPLTIGTGTTSPIFAEIPYSTPSGTGYRIRVVSSSSPIVIGTDNGTNLSTSTMALAQLQIDGPLSPYESSTVTYSIWPVYDLFNFFWTVPTGWTILKGQGTTSITVSVGKQGDISVRGENFCHSFYGYYPVKPIACSASGSILREYWANISGTSVSAIPVNTTPPTATSELTSFEAPSNVADNYGQRIRGYICAPATGSYTFYIAGDDDGELWLSPDDNVVNKQRIAYYTGWTSTREWNKFTSQKSVTIQLQANTRYYIEVLHKEASGGDKLAVGWLTPGASAIAIIPGAVLSPVTATATNQPPTVSLTSPATGTSFTAPASITITANAADADGTISKVEFFHGATKLGEDATAPYSYSWTGVAAGTYSLIAKATDDKGVTATSAPVSVTVHKGLQTITFPVIPEKAYGDAPFALEATSTSGLQVSYRVISGPATVSGKILTITGVGVVAVQAYHPGNEIYSAASPVDQSFTITPALTCTATGTILREYWDNIPGTNYSVPRSTTPTSTSYLTSFEAPTNVADDYVQIISGYICAPVSGDYTFYLAGDDDCELSLAYDDNPENGSQRIAYIIGYTNPREWNKYPTQKSAVITLRANTRYYIAAIGKEAIGGDHLAVGWVIPGTSAITVIPGSVLSPAIPTYTNQPPTVSLTSPATGATFTAPAIINLAANAADVDGTISKVEFFHAATKLGEDATAPYSYSWTGVAAGTYSLTAKATDDKGVTATSAPVSVTVNAVIAGCSASGSILREYWANISGTSVAAIPVTTTPTATSELTSFEAPANVADNYGQRIRGYICAPATGSYTFYIAGDDDGELWLSPDGNAANKQRIAFYTGWTSTREWNKFATQKSAVITLQANTRYYIEALHKEASGGDKLAVGWTTPGSSVIAVIPGAVLSPVTATATNQPPTVSLTSPATGASFTAPATITLAANAADGDGTISKVEFFHAATKLGEDATAPYSYSWTGVAAGTYSLTAKATDDKGVTATSAPVSVTVNAVIAGCSASGSILREYWANISGTSVAAIPVTTTPTATSELTSFEAPANVADNYGQRIRGYICAPATGSYTFYIAGDDDGELWLSPDGNAANKQRIAFYTGWTSTREWNKFASQKSVTIQLQANTRYYIEALHKEASGGDKLAVGWLTPGSSAIAVIPGAVLSPVITASAVQVISRPDREPEVYVGTGQTFRMNPNPFRNKATIEFSFDQKEEYQVLIYNVRGSLVKALQAGKAEANTLVTMEWADERIPAGVYLVRLITKNSVQTLRVVRE